MRWRYLMRRRLFRVLRGPATAFLVVSLLLTSLGQPTILSPRTAHADLLLNDQFNDAVWGSWVGAGGGSQSMDGAELLLTPDLTNLVGGALYNSAVDGSDGLIVEFRYYSADGNGADGISFFLVNGSAAALSLGDSGSSLAYSDNKVNEDSAGLDGGWLGVGLDEYGNYGSSGSQDDGPYSSATAGIGLRGSEGKGYPWIAGAAETSMGNNSIDAGYRRIKATLGPTSGAGSNEFKVEWDANDDGTYDYTPVNINLGDYTSKVDTRPATFKFGFAASTGGQRNKHSIDWVTVNTVVSDVTAPTVSSITPSVSNIGEGTVGTGTFYIDINFDDTMDTGTAPTVTFPAEDPSSTLSGASGSWADSDTYRVSYNVADANQILGDIDVRVAGAKDSSTNTMVAQSVTNVFSIDTAVPGAASVTAPVNGTSHTPATVPASFTGSVADNSGGLGLNANSATFTLRRSDNQYWTSSAWVGSTSWLTTTHDATASNTAAAWTSNVTLPSWGIYTYTVQARAIDKASNVFTGTAVTFSISGTTNTTLASSVNPSSFGQAVTFTATVTSTLGTPGGTVTFKDGAATLGTATLSSGTATHSTSALAVGSRSITAEYAGDSSFTASNSSTLTQTVNKANSSTTLVSSANPTSFGETLTFTATVTSGGGAPTGTVTFKDGASTVGSASLSSGSATYVTTTMTAGTHSMTAEYGGDSSFNASTSSVLSQSVGGAATTSTVTPSANPSTYGQTVTFTANVTSGAGTPTGTVTFKDGAATLGSASLSSGTAAFATASLSAGTHSITAEYGGASNFAASTSSALSQTVNKASTTTAMASSPNPSTSGQSVTFTASASSAAGTPTGSVTFKDGATAMGTASLSGGVAAYSTSSLSAGTHSVTAEYAGDANFSSSASSGLSQVINAAFSAAAWPDNFAAYLYSDGSPIFDPAQDEHPGYADVSSGVADGTGTLPSVYTAGDGSNFFFRFRIKSNPADAAKGGFESTAYSMAIAVNGAKVAVVGLDGKSPSTDYVYVSNADGSSVDQVYSTPFTGAQAGARAISDGAGAYFLDIQVPISRVSAVAPSVTASTPVQFFFGTSQAANLSVINKDFVPGSSVDFTNMATTRLQGLTATATSLASSVNPSDQGQEVTFTATVTGPGGTPSGTVTFKEGNTALGAGTLSGGAATFKTASLSVGSHSVTAVYGGDSSFAGSTSSGVLQVVNLAGNTTATTLVSSLNPSAPLQPILLTATVAAAGQPSGTVTFKDGTTTLGSAALSGGQALFTTSSLATGNHNITAEYGGDSSFNPSASAVLVQAVLPSRWLPVGAGGPGIHAMVFTPQGSLYVGGSFPRMGGIWANSVAMWDGATWSALGGGTNGPVFALASDRNGNLYAGGKFTAAGGASTNNIAMWNGTKWSPLGAGVGGQVKALAVDSKGNVYAGGIFTTAGGSAANFVARWDGNKWSALGSGVNNLVVALQLDASDNLYAGGMFKNAGGSKASFVARWDGGKWSALGTGVSAQVEALALDASGNLYAGGHTVVGSLKGIAKWNGNTWSALGSGVDHHVLAMAVDGSGNVYAGGRFTVAGGITVNRVARWDGSSWSPMGAGFNNEVVALAVDTNGTPYAAGRFTQAGDRAISGIAVYRPAVDTTTTLTSTPNPADYGQRIVLSASVAATVGTPVGYLTFEDSYYSNRTILGRVALLEGQAVLNVDQALYQGTHSIVARYEGAATHLASSSTALSQVVRATPALSIEALARNVSGPEPPAAAKSSVYAITLKAYNPGSGDLNKVVITAQVPAGATVKSVAKDMTFSGQTVTWRYGGENGATISGNGSASSSFEVEVSPTASDTGQNITLLQSASASGTNPLTGDSLTASAGAVTVGPVAVSEGTISGAVKDGLSQGGLSKATVQVYDSLNTLSATVSTGNDGTYSVPKLAAGQYRLVFSKPNHLEYISKATVLAGQTTTEDATLTPLAGSLTGKITNAATGEALPSAIVMVQDTAGAYEEKDVSNPAGNFAFGNIPAGIPLLVSATHPDYTTGVESSAAPQEKYSTKSQTGKAYTVGLKLYPKPGEINGTVTDQSARTALGGVKVTAYDAKDNQVGTATTDSAGLYVLTGLSAGAYTLRFSRDPEYQPASGSVQVMPGQTANLDQALALRSGTVSGVVTGTGGGTRLRGTRIPGAKVLLLSSLGLELGSATTNDKGEYQFAGLTPGSYSLEASASSYQDTSASRATVTLSAGGSVTQDLQLAPSPGAITGQITDAQTGAALSGASVQVYDQNSNPTGKTTSDSTGAYSVTNIPPGAYSLLFSQAGYYPGSASAQVPQGNTVTANGILKPKAGSIAGTIVDAATRQPLSGATVTLLDSNGVAQASALSDGNGKFAFSGLLPGTYTLEAEHADYTTASEGRASLTLGAGGSTTQDLGLNPKPGNIGGKITSAATGDAIAGVKVIAYDAKMNLVGMGVTDATGAYTITNLVPGAYTVSADGSPLAYLPAKGSADVGPGQSKSVDLVLTAATGTLSGTVTNASSSDPLAGINVTLTYPDGSVVTARTSGTGEYVFTGVTAQVSLSVAAQGMPPFYLENTGSGAARMLGAGGSARVNLVLQPGPGRITGTVTGPVGAVTGASMRLYDANQNLVAETDTDGNGIYTLSGLAPGAYTLLFSKVGYLGSSYSPKIDPGATTTLNIRVTALAGAIQGVIKSSSTLLPLPKASASLLDSNGTTLETVLADATGRYSFSSVSPGSYRVTAEHPDYITGTGGKSPVSMSPGGSATRDLSLDPRPASISGRISSATTGEALAGIRVMAFDAKGNLSGAVTTDENGDYNITGLLDGDYVLTADGSAQGYLLSSANSTLKPGQSEVLNLALLPRAGSLSGILTNAANGEAIPDIEVVLTYPDGKEARVRSNGAGEYVFMDVRAEVLLTLTASETSFYMRMDWSTATGTAPAGGSATAHLKLKPRPGAITGKVESVLGPVTSAKLSLYNENSSLVEIGFSDPSGIFTFPALAPGKYTLIFSKAGYLSSTYTVLVKPGATTRQNIFPTPLAGSIAGTVKGLATLKPLSGAIVNLVDLAGVIVDSVLTDNSGRYSFSRVTPGTYQVLAGHTDYLSGTQAQATGSLSPEGYLSLNLLLAPRPATISGRVVSATTGQAVPGAVIRVYEPDGDLLTTVTADGNGNYVVKGVPESSEPYTLESTASNYLPGGGKVGVASGQKALLNLSLVPKLGSLAGRVTDSVTGKPIAGASVEVKSENGSLLAMARSDRAGGFLFIGLPSQASLTINATAPNYRTIAASSATVPFVLSAGVSAAQRRAAAASATVELQLGPNPGSVSGKAKDVQTGAPLPGATVQLYDAKGNLVATATTDPTGAYTFPDVPVGDYTISVVKNGFLAGSSSISVDAGQAGATDVPLPPEAGSVSGTVRDSSLTPLAGATVALADLAGQVTFIITQGDGTYFFAGLPPGTYSLQTSHTDYDTGSGSATNLILDPGAAGKADLTLYPRPATVGGTVTDAVSEQPLPGVNVAVLDASGNQLGAYSTDSQGLFRLSNLAAGSYTLVFSRAGYLDSSSSLTVKPNQSVDLMLGLTTASQSISGIVKDGSTGRGIGGATVVLLDGPGTILFTAKSNNTGRYSFGGLTPGTYTVLATHSDYDAGEGSQVQITMISGEAAVQDLRLESKKGAIEVTVVDNTMGLVISGATIAITFGNSPIATLSSNSDGIASADGLARGAYTVTASTSGRASRSAAVTVESNRKSALVLRLGYAVRIQVLEKDTGETLTGVTVSLSKDGGEAAAGVTGADGVLLLEVTATGNYGLSVSGVGFDQVSQSSGSVSVYPETPAPSATLYLSRQKAPHLTLEISRFIPRQLPFEVRGMAARSELIYYGLSYANSGSAPATGVVITNTIPAGTSFVGPQEWVQVNERTYTHSVGTVAPGDRGSLTLVVAKEGMSTPGTIYTNTASIGDDGRNGRDLKMASAVTNEFGLYVTYFPQLYRNWGGAW